MGDTPPASIPPPPLDPFNIDFNFMVLQGNPRTDSIYFWLDGEKNKHKMMREVFLKLIKLKDEGLVAKAYEACNTYSFYLWDINSKSLIHLTPRGTNDAPYPDSLHKVIQGLAVPREVSSSKFGEKRTIVDVLSGYGFSTPTEYAMDNMQVEITANKPAKEDKFSMLRKLLSGRR
jgi:hypothetical protein